MPAVAAAAVVTIVLGQTWPMLDLPYPRWVHTSAQWHQQFTWAGPIAGAAAA